MTKKAKKTIYWSIGGAVVIGFTAWLIVGLSQPGPLDAFAKCLKDKGATYYGAFWCPNCQRQNDLFGKSKKHTPYVECSTPDGQGQKQVCQQAEITNYPTWEFADGSRDIGVQPLEDLAEKTGCELPR
ncbi:MAG TPA: hypothetical protein VGA49_02045 [Patescibacteria group bacterium]